jgi:hypothetical protein
MPARREPAGATAAIVGHGRNGRGRSAAVLCAGFEYKIGLYQPPLQQRQVRLGSDRATAVTARPQ